MPTPARRQDPAGFNRGALLPGILAAVVLVAGLALIGNDWFLAVRYVACIFALIICVFAVQAKKQLWLIGLVPIAVLWNPVVPITIDDTPWRLMQLAAAIVFIAAGVQIKSPIEAKRS